MIKRTFSYLNQESVLTLYKTFVRPQLEFAIQVWHPYNQYDIDQLEKVQRRATKLIPALKHLRWNWYPILRNFTSFSSFNVNK